MGTNKFLQQPLYRVWLNIKQRCYNPKNPSYKYYGENGVKVCGEWLARKIGYINFKKWALSKGYVETKGKNKYTIDRIDVNGNYEPNNCRLATMQEQSLNKRNTYYVFYNGKKTTLKELSKIFGINYFTLHNRLKTHKLENSLNPELNSTRISKKTNERYITKDNSNKYIVRVKKKYYGYFKDLEEAKKVRDNACRLCKRLFLGEKV